jgi:hypothetical protein
MPFFALLLRFQQENSPLFLSPQREILALSRSPPKFPVLRIGIFPSFCRLAGLHT